MTGFHKKKIVLHTCFVQNRTDVRLQYVNRLKTFKYLLHTSHLETATGASGIIYIYAQIAYYIIIISARIAVPSVWYC